MIFRKLSLIPGLFLIWSLLVWSGCGEDNPTAPVSKPVLLGITPPGAGPGAIVTLTGRGFGTEKAVGEVIFHNDKVATEYESWSDTLIEVVVPDDVYQWSRAGVRVRVGHKESESIDWIGLPPGITQITDGTRPCTQPTWNNDGTTLYFVITDPSTFESDIWKIPVAGGPPSQVSSHAGSEDSPDVQPLSGVLAIRTFRDGVSEVSIWTSVDHQIPVDPTDGNDHCPAWSPGGGGRYELAYTRGTLDTITTNITYDIHGYFGGHSDQLTTGGFDFEPTWSPNGNKIAYRHNLEIWVVNVADLEVTQLTVNETDLTPHWGLDGRILFIRHDRNAASANIWVMNGDGSEQQELLATPCDVSSARWSPDGNRVAFTMRCPGFAESTLYVDDVP